MSGVADLTERRRQRQRELLDGKPRWTGREALEAALADIDSGDLDADMIVVVYASSVGAEGDVKVGRYVGSMSPRGKRDGLWCLGAMTKCITDWARGG